jgi:RNA recognition motif-containing protein
MIRLVSELEHPGRRETGDTVPQNKIYVGNIAYAAKVEELRVLFEPYGEIEDIALATDKESGKFRGFAIVMMPNSDDAARAIAGVDGHRLRGRRLVVNEAVKKNKLAKQATESASAGSRGVGGGGLARRVRASSASRPRRGGRNPRRG